MKKHCHREMLNHLADELVNDVLNTPDEEILSEAAEDFGSAQAVADHVRGILAKAQLQAAKQNLVAARRAVDQQNDPERRAKVISLDPVRARRALKNILQDCSSDLPITLAARKETELSDSDVLTMLEDLQSLGLFNPDFEEESDK
jgi:hypothetical protein